MWSPHIKFTHRWHKRTTCLRRYFLSQAEDGIRDIGVTGVQTCALPICADHGIAVDHRSRSDVAVASDRSVRVHDSPGRQHGSVPDYRLCRHIRQRMHRGEEACPERPDGVRQTQPYGVVRNSHDDVHGLYREHALQHRNVPKYRKTAPLVRKYRVRVVVEANPPTFEPARDQNIQRKTPVATRPYDGQSYTLIEDSFLNLNLRFNYASSGL